jgi:hypothetical protein
MNRKRISFASVKRASVGNFQKCNFTAKEYHDACNAVKDEQDWYILRSRERFLQSVHYFLQTGSIY